MTTLYVNEYFRGNSGGMANDNRNIFYNMDVLRSSGLCRFNQDLFVAGKFICLMANDTESDSKMQLYYNFVDGSISIWHFMDKVPDLIMRNRIMELFQKATLLQSGFEEVELVKGLPPNTSNN